MTCEKCNDDMIYNYEVEERNVLFVLWDCECGHKLLERRYQKKMQPSLNANAVVQALAAAAAGNQLIGAGK